MARNNLRKDCRINFAPETASRIKPLPISFHPPRGGSDSLSPSDFLYSPASLPLNIFLRLFIFNFPARLIVSLRFFLIPSPLLSLSLPLLSPGEKKKETPGRPIGGESWRRNGGWIFYHFCFGATEMGKRGVLIYIYTYIEGLDSGTRLNGFARTVRPSVFKIRIRCIKILREMKEERRVKNSLCSKRKKIVVVEWEIVFCVKKIKEKYVASKGKWQQI